MYTMKRLLLIILSLSITLTGMCASKHKNSSIVIEAKTDYQSSEHIGTWLGTGSLNRQGTLKLYQNGYAYLFSKPYEMGSLQKRRKAICCTL